MCRADTASAPPLTHTYRLAGIPLKSGDQPQRDASKLNVANDPKFPGQKFPGTLMSKFGTAVTASGFASCKTTQSVPNQGRCKSVPKQGGHYD
jgi:hypothetical protein